MNSLRFMFLSALKISGYALYPSRLNWLSEEPDSWDDISLILILNHTSLFEFVYGVTLPFGFLNQISKRLIIPVAESTLKKPLGGLVFNQLAPKTIALSRKRDESWSEFLNQISREDICIFMPEGRMRRADGLDKHGKTLHVKSGVYELLNKFRGRKMLLVYSGGLHHVLAPGQVVPRVFRHVKAGIECLSVDEYLGSFEASDQPWKDIAGDLDFRRDECLKNMGVHYDYH